MKTECRKGTIFARGVRQEAPSGRCLSRAEDLLTERWKAAPRAETCPTPYHSSRSETE